MSANHLVTCCVQGSSKKAVKCEINAETPAKRNSGFNNILFLSKVKERIGALSKSNNFESENRINVASVSINDTSVTINDASVIKINQESIEFRSDRSETDSTGDPMTFVDDRLYLDLLFLEDSFDQIIDDQKPNPTNHREAENLRVVGDAMFESGSSFSTDNATTTWLRILESSESVESVDLDRIVRDFARAKTAINCSSSLPASRHMSAHELALNYLPARETIKVSPKISLKQRVASKAAHFPRSSSFNETLVHAVNMESTRRGAGLKEEEGGVNNSSFVFLRKFSLNGAKNLQKMKPKDRSKSFRALRNSFSSIKSSTYNLLNKRFAKDKDKDARIALPGDTTVERDSAMTGGNDTTTLWNTKEEDVLEDRSNENSKASNENSSPSNGYLTVPEITALSGDVNSPLNGYLVPEITPLTNHINLALNDYLVPEIKKLTEDANTPLNGYLVPEIKELTDNANTPLYNCLMPEITPVTDDVNSPFNGYLVPKITPLTSHLENLFKMN